jgi:hypothetical protein
MKISCQLLSLFLVLSLGGVSQALALVGADVVCPDCAKGACSDASPCPDCVACPGRSPAISQPDGPMKEAQSGHACSVSSDGPVVALELSSIFHPPKAC